MGKYLIIIMLFFLCYFVIIIRNVPMISRELFPDEFQLLSVYEDDVLALLKSDFTAKKVNEMLATGNSDIM